MKKRICTGVLAALLVAASIPVGIGAAQTVNAEAASYSTLFGDVTGATHSMPSIGDVNALVFMVDFQDEKIDYSAEELSDMLFGEADENSEEYPYESASAYYERSSFGKFSLQGDVYTYTAKHERSYYDNNFGTCIEEIISYYTDTIESQVDGSEEEKKNYLNETLSRYDENDDGIIDGIYINYAGETTGYGTQWWSYVNYWNGYEIGDYTFGSTCMLESKTCVTLSAIHETGHMLGLADYYDVDVDVTNSFDMMSTNYGEQDGFSRMLLGWLDEDDVQIITQGGLEDITLNAYAQSGDIAVIVPDYDESKGLYTEFYMLEYYNSVGNDTIPNEADGRGLEDVKGVRIYHVDARLSDDGLSFATSNTQWSNGANPLITQIDKDALNSHTRVFSDARPQYSSMMWSDWGEGEYDCFYFEGDELTPYSFPSSAFYGSDRFDAGQYSGITVKNIRINGDSVTLTAGIEEEKTTPELQYEVTESGANKHHNSVEMKLQFNTEIRLKNQKATIDEGYLIDPNGEKVTGLTLSYNPYNMSNCELSIEATDSSVILENQKYTIVIPENTIMTSYGVGNKQIEISYDVAPYGLERYSVQDVENCQIAIDENGNGAIVFARKEEEQSYLALCPLKDYVQQNEVKISGIEWNDEGLTNGSVFVFDDGTYGISIISNDEMVVYDVNSKGKVLSSYKKDITGWRYYAFDDGFMCELTTDYGIVYDLKNKTEKKYTLKNIPDKGEKVDGMDDKPVKVEYLSDEKIAVCMLSGRIYVLDAAGNVIADIYGLENTTDMEIRLGDIAVIDGEYFVSYSLYPDTGSFYTDEKLYVDIYDADFKLSEKYYLPDINGAPDKIYDSGVYILVSNGDAYVYDNLFRLITKMDGTCSRYDSNKTTFASLYFSGSSVKGSAIDTTLYAVTDDGSNEIRLPDKYATDNDTIVISEKTSKEDFKKQLGIHLTAEFSSEDSGKYMTDGSRVDITSENGNHTKYFTIKLDYEDITPGDINGDDAINISDLMLVLNHVSGKKTLNGDGFDVADVNGDGKVDLQDLMKILNYVSGKSKEID